MKSGNLNFLEPSGPLQACNGTALPFYFITDYVASTQYMTVSSELEMWKAGILE